MKYFDYLEQNKNNITECLDGIFKRYKVQPVGYGYVDCITMRDKFEDFVNDISELGVVVNISSWWCYVNPNNPSNCGCPQGIGGPLSEYYDGWFSELQNDLYDVGEVLIDNIKEEYDLQLLTSINMKVINDINYLLKTPFKYTPIDVIEGNKCVVPGLWLLVPNDWRR